MSDDRKVLHLPSLIDRELAVLSRRYQERTSQPPAEIPVPEDPVMADEVEALKQKYSAILAGPIEVEKEPATDE